MNDESKVHICYLHLSLRERFRLLFGAGIRVSLEFKGEPPKYLHAPNMELSVEVVPK